MTTGDVGSRPRTWRWTLPLVALALAGLAVHGWFALGADALDADRALVLLMARHFAQGDLSLFLWQQNYMAALEPLLLTPLALTGRATPVAAAWVGIGLTAGLAGLCVSLVRRLGGAPWMALLLWALPPAVVVHHHVALYGARLTATLLAVGAFALALRTRTTRGWILTGAILGLAYFGDHLMLTWATGVAYVAARRGRVTPLALGAAPLVVVDTVAALLTPAVHLAGPNDPGGWLANVPLLIGTTLPQLFGLLLGRPPGPLFEEGAAVVPASSYWPFFAVPSALALVALVVTLSRQRRALFGPDAGDGGTATTGLVLVGAAGAALFALIGGGGDRWPVRYLVPLWPAISVLAAVAVARWRPRLRLAATVVVLPALFTLSADRSWPRGGDGSAARAEAAAVGAAVARSGAGAVWADYWDVYRMALLVGESPRWVTLRIIERRPDWVVEAVRSSPVAYLLRRGDAEVRDRLVEADRQDAARMLSAHEVGRYRLALTDRSVPGLVLIQRPPSRARQHAAALLAPRRRPAHQR